MLEAAVIHLMILKIAIYSKKYLIFEVMGIYSISEI